MTKKVFPYPNIAIFVSILLLLINFSDSPIVVKMIGLLSSFGHLGSIFAGIFFVSSFTVAPATFLLTKLSENYGLVEVAIFGAVGAVIGDYLIFRFFKDGFFDEVSSIFSKYKIKGLSKKDSTLFKKYVQPVLGAIIIASPFPDEIGVAMLGLSGIKKMEVYTYNFHFKCYWHSNTIGYILK